MACASPERVRDCGDLRLQRKHELLTRALSDPQTARRGAQFGEGTGTAELTASARQRRLHTVGWWWRAAGEIGDLEDLDEVDDEEFERLLALAEEEEEFVDIDGEDFDRLGL